MVASRRRARGLVVQVQPFGLNDISKLELTDFRPGVESKVFTLTAVRGIDTVYMYF